MAEMVEPGECQKVRKGPAPVYLKYLDGKVWLLTLADAPRGCGSLASLRAAVKNAGQRARLSVSSWFTVNSLGEPAVAVQAVGKIREKGGDWSKGELPGDLAIPVPAPVAGFDGVLPAAAMRQIDQAATDRAKLREVHAPAGWVRQSDDVMTVGLMVPTGAQHGVVATQTARNVPVVYPNQSAVIDNRQVVPDVAIPGKDELDF